MASEVMMIWLRNILLFQFLVAFSIAGDSPRLHQELLKIWKTLNTPLLQKKPGKPNHKSGKFWEIDMTDFEP